MVDPNWWPLASGLGMMAQQAPHRGHAAPNNGAEEEGKTLGEIVLAWGPAVLTAIVAPVVGYLASELHDLKAAEARHDVEISALRVEQEAQNQRLNIHRSELDTLNRAHMSNGK